MLFYFSSTVCFSLWPLLPTRCMSRELLLHLTTPNDSIPPLGEGSARRRDLYVTTHKRKTPTPPSIPASERPQTHAVERAATGVTQCDRPHVTNSLTTWRQNPAFKAANTTAGEWAWPRDNSIQVTSFALASNFYSFVLRYHFPTVKIEFLTKLKFMRVWHVEQKQTVIQGLNQASHHKDAGGSRVYLRTLFSSTTDGAEKCTQLQRPGQFTPSIHWREKWKGPHSRSALEKKKMSASPGNGTPVLT